MSKIAMNFLNQKLYICLLFAVLRVELWAAPAISIDKTVLDFKTFSASEAQSASVIITNPGDSVLKIERIRKTCGCSVAEPESKTIAPGESTKLAITIIANSLKGRFSKKIFIETNAPNNRFNVISLIGNAQPRISVTPTERIYPPRLRLNEEATFTFTVKAQADDVVFTAPTIDANYPMSVKGEQSAQNTFTITATVTPAISKGKLAATLFVPTSQDGTKITKLYITADVGPAIYCLPGRITIPKRSQTFETSLKLKFVGISPSLIDTTKLNWQPIDGVEIIPQPLNKETIPVRVIFDQQKLNPSSLPKIIFNYPETQAVSCKLQIR